MSRPSDSTDAIRCERRPGTNEDYTVFGRLDRYLALGLMYKVPFNSGWRFCRTAASARRS